MQNYPNDFDETLKQLQSYFPYDGKILDRDIVDWLESLPYYIEKESFICVYAGVQLDGCGVNQRDTYLPRRGKRLPVKINKICSSDSVRRKRNR